MAEITRTSTVKNFLKTYSQLRVGIAPVRLKPVALKKSV